MEKVIETTETVEIPNAGGKMAVFTYREPVGGAGRVLREMPIVRRNGGVEKEIETVEVPRVGPVDFVYQWPVRN